MMDRDIAIIGMAGRFPGAANIGSLLENLAEGRDSVKDISAERVKRTALDGSKSYLTAGYLDDIDLFDAAFFNISPGEAKTMDPHIRLLLEVVYETIENAAYSAAMLGRSKTAVFVADSALEYYRHADEFTPTLASGNTKAFLATTISRQFDLRGNSLVVDTTCSSSLMAIHLACNEILLGDADMALAAGANLYLFPYRDNIGLDLDAPDGRSKAFSDAANGMSHGEAIACVLLKKLDRALADKDIIHAVIKGSATNCNAHRSASLTAPDSQAQAEVMKLAWDKAGIVPTQLGFIEAHGSGTVLGDNIEIGGFTIAFEQFTSSRSCCPISTIKSNIGHTRSAAGISGLIRAVLSLSHRLIFPTVHFDRPHPQINFSRSAVFVNRELRPWHTAETRYAAVSSIGLSGTNCHIVLQEAPALPGRPDIYDTKVPVPRLLPVSAATHQSLVENIKALRDHLADHPDTDPADLAYTLGTGRTHYSYRQTFIAGSIQEAITAMNAFLKRPVPRIMTPEKLSKLIFLLEDMPAPSCDEDTSDPIPGLLFQYSLSKMLEEWGIMAEKLLGRGRGRLIADIIRTGAGTGDIANSLPYYPADRPEDLSQKIAALLREETKDGPVAFVSIGPAGRVGEELARQIKGVERAWHIASGEDQDPMALLLMVQSLYELNYDLVWPSSAGRKIGLPAYRFDRKRYWLRDTPKPENTASAVSDSGARPGQPIQKQSADEPGFLRELRICWEETLSLHDISDTADFFELGGDSLKATRLIKRINAAYGISMSFEDMFDFPTLRAWNEYLEKISTTEQKVHKIWKDVLQQDDLGYLDDFFELGGHSLIANQIINRIRSWWRVGISFDDFFTHPTIRSMSSYVDSLASRSQASFPMRIPQLPAREYYDMSHAQKRLWILCQSQEGSLAYNQAGVYGIGSELDAGLLEQAFNILIDRHESLRTIFTVEKGDPVQKILSQPDNRFRFKYLDFRERGNPEKAALAFVTEMAGRPFDLEQGPLMRAFLVQTDDPGYIFLLDLHHIITDGWSNGILIRDLLTIYASLISGREAALPALRVQYKDYAAWQHNRILSGDYDPHRQYWLSEFAEPAAPLELPTDNKRPALRSYRGSIVEFSLDPALTTRLRQQCREKEVTLFMLLLANLYIFLYRLSGQTDITIGTPIAGRDHFELEEQIGFYANTLAIRAHIAPDKDFSRFLALVRQQTLNAYAHGSYPFDMLVDELSFERHPGHFPLFDVMLTFQNMENESRYKGTIAEQLDVRSYETDIQVSKFDLTFSVSEQTDSVDVLLEYDTDLFSAARIAKMKDTLITLLELTTGTDPMSIADLRRRLSASTDAEQAAFYRAFSQTDLDD